MFNIPQSPSPQPPPYTPPQVGKPWPEWLLSLQKEFGIPSTGCGSIPPPATPNPLLEKLRDRHRNSKPLGPTAPVEACPEEVVPSSEVPRREMPRREVPRCEVPEEVPRYTPFSSLPLKHDDRHQ